MRKRIGRSSQIGWAAVLLMALACGHVEAQQPGTNPPVGQGVQAVPGRTVTRYTSTTRKPVARESARATAARQRTRKQLATAAQAQAQAASRQYAWQFPGYGFGTPPVWGSGGYGFGYAPGWNYPGYPAGYYPTWSGYYGGYGVGMGAGYPGAIGTGIASGTVLGNGALSTGVTASPAAALPNSPFGVNRGISVNGGTYLPGQGVIGSGAGLPPAGR